MDHLETIRQWCTNNHCPLLFNEALSKHTTMKVGGAAELFALPKSAEQLQGLVALAHQQGVPITMLGNGSNVLVSDQGIMGLVICLGNGFSQITPGENGTFWSTAGTPLSLICRYALDNQLTGLEFAWGIPASTGGAAYMNAGAYGGEMKDVVRRVQAISPTGQLEEWSLQQLEMSYRHTALMESERIVSAVEFQLQPGNAEAIKARMAELLGRRKEKQPLEYPSAGSTFKRPEGAYAAALIDQCGLKGHRVGGAMISEKHAGFLINYDHATCADILELIRQVQEIVQTKTGYYLECEVKQLGEF